MALISRILGRKTKLHHEAGMLHLIARVSMALGQEFHEGKVDNRKGFVSSNGKVGVLPPKEMPSCARRLKEIDVKELVRLENATGVYGGTFVNSQIFDGVIDSISKDGRDYTILIDRNAETPMVVATPDGNIVIAHMERSCDLHAIL